MSKVDDAIAKEREVKRLSEALGNQIPIANRRDKTGMYWRAEKGKETREWALITHFSHGEYGSSSAHDDGSEALAKEIAQTLTEMRDQIVSHTVNRLNRELGKVYRAAESEAAEIVAKAKSWREEGQDVCGTGDTR